MIYSLQACRGLAVLLVVLHHTTAIFSLPKYFGARPFGATFHFGESAVEFFFVLSGFVIAYVHGKEVGRPNRLGAYLWKRLTRVYPVYWAALLPVVGALLVVPEFGKGHERNLDVLACSALLLPHPAPTPVLVVAWTLVYELFFYLLFAALIADRRLGAALLACWVGVMAGVHGFPGLATFPWTFLGSVFGLRFLAGVLLAWAFRRVAFPFPRVLAAVGGTAFVAVGLCYGGDWLAHHPLIGFMPFCVLVIAGLAEAERRGLLHAPRALVHLGDASYSLYLVHYPALSLLTKLAHRARLDQWVPAEALFLALAAGSMAVSYLFFRAVELPIRRRLQPRPPAAAPVAEPAPRRAAA